jgi:DNA mismatch repair protein MutH
MENLKLGYNPSDAASIEGYSKKLIGKTFKEVRDSDTDENIMVREASEYNQDFHDKKRKGDLGEMIEERFFHYHCNDDSRPDFPNAGVELKVTPYKINKNKSLSAKERLIITMIDYHAVVKEDFENSHLWAKSRRILLIYYLFQETLKDKLRYRIDYVKLFTPPEKDLDIIKHDFQFIVDKVKAGKAHELSESDTMYLGAATKAATSENRRTQPFSTEKAKPRAFSFKSSYMTYVLNHYIVPGKTEDEEIVKESTEKPFEEYVQDKIKVYAGKSVEELCGIFGLSFEKPPKSLEAILTYRMLGIKGNKAEEFEKANIVIKTIRIGANGKIKESMSFPAFRFVDIVQQEWETSDLYNYLSETRFLFVIYRFDKAGRLILRGSQFWNIPVKTLDTDVKAVWERAKKVISEGLIITYTKNGMENNLPKMSENPVCHVRPHARDSRDTYDLPDGRKYPKQCFWLNNGYILGEISDNLKKQE